MPLIIGVVLAMLDLDGQGSMNERVKPRSRFWTHLRNLPRPMSPPQRRSLTRSRGGAPLGRNCNFCWLAPTNAPRGHVRRGLRSALTRDDDSSMMPLASLENKGQARFHDPILSRTVSHRHQVKHLGAEKCAESSFTSVPTLH